jgi:uncharacterized damage-inducible protein DinB
MSQGNGFLDRPGVAGMFGALMDEYARAAEDFCRTVEALSTERFLKEIPSEDPDTVSLRAMCRHAVGASHRYADYILQARGLPFVDRFVLPPEEVLGPADVRGALAAAMRHTETALAGWYEKPELAAEVSFVVRWGPTYDPEMILEHAIVHLLRHRRQVERWPS